MKFRLKYNHILIFASSLLGAFLLMYGFVVDSGFIGSLFGSLVSGLIAIFILTRQINYDKEKEKRKELENFIKSYYLIHDWASAFYASIVGLIKCYSDTSNDNNNDIWIKIQIETHLNGIRECKSEFEQINDDYIPQEIYKDFLSIKSMLKICEVTCESILKDELYHINYKDRFTLYKEKTKEIFIKVKEYGEKKEKELKEIKGY